MVCVTEKPQDRLLLLLCSVRTRVLVLSSVTDCGLFCSPYFLCVGYVWRYVAGEQESFPEGSSGFLHQHEQVTDQ